MEVVEVSGLSSVTRFGSKLARAVKASAKVMSSVVLAEVTVSGVSIKVSWVVVG